jgi:hypothetical protein
VVRFLFILLFCLPLFAQRADFYDTYDYNMKNYKGGDNVGEGSYKEYELPPKNQKPALVTPKNVQRQPELNSLLQGQIGIRRSNNQAQNPTPQMDNLVINPVTGKINPDALLRQREKEKQNKEKKRQFANREIEPYVETRARRMEIIFLTTFPFAVALSVGITVLLGSVHGNQLILQQSFIKSTPGFAFVTLLACGFSTANVISDINAYDAYMKNKKEANPNLPPPEIQSQLFKNQPNINFSFVVGSVNF